MRATIRNLNAIPRLCVVVPTVKPWPQARRALDPLREQALATNSAIMIVDGYGGVPSRLGAPFETLSLVGADVFRLRAAAVEHAQGDLIALLEDHVTVPHDWCANLIRAFGERPDAAGVVGSVTNGAPRLLDRANFLLNFAPFLAPLDDVPGDRCPPPGVVAYRRTSIQAGPYQPGWLEFGLPASLRDRGLLMADDRVKVTHIQHVGARAFRLQYHAGRVFGGCSPAPPAPQSRGAQLAQALRIPVVLSRQTLRSLRRRGYTESHWCLAGIGVLGLANGLGQVVGVLRGTVGESPRQLE